MIDTLSLSKDFIEADISVKQAEAIAISMGQFIQKELTDFKAEIQNDSTNHKNELQKKLANFKVDLQKDLRKVSTDSLKWVAGMILAQTVLLFTLVKLFG